jgi:hypothetical protein
MEVTKTISVPILQLPFNILKFFREGKHSSAIGRASLSPPLSYQVMERGVTKPHQLKLKWRLLGNNNITSAELDRPVVRTSPIKNFRGERDGARKPETRN